MLSRRKAESRDQRAADVLAELRSAGAEAARMLEGLAGQLEHTVRSESGLTASERTKIEGFRSLCDRLAAQLWATIDTLNPERTAQLRGAVAATSAFLKWVAVPVGLSIGANLLTEPAAKAAMALGEQLQHIVDESSGEGAPGSAPEPQRGPREEESESTRSQLRPRHGVDDQIRREFEELRPSEQYPHLLQMADRERAELLVQVRDYDFARDLNSQGLKAVLGWIRAADNQELSVDAQQRFVDSLSEGERRGLFRAMDRYGRARLLEWIQSPDERDELLSSLHPRYLEALRKLVQLESPGLWEQLVVATADENHSEGLTVERILGEIERLSRDPRSIEYDRLTDDQLDVLHEAIHSVRSLDRTGTQQLMDRLTAAERKVVFEALDGDGPDVFDGIRDDQWETLLQEALVRAEDIESS